MPLSRALVATLLCLLTSASARAMRVYVPLPCAVAQSDLVAIGEVIEVVGERERPFTYPGTPAPRDVYMRTVKVKVQTPLYSPVGQKSGDVITVVMMAQKPVPAPPAGQGAMALPRIADGPIYPDLKVGETGGLILQRVAGEDETYYLQGGGDNWTPSAQKEQLDRLITVAAVDTWHWGTTVDDLQIAIVPDYATFTVPKTIHQDMLPRLSYVVVIRNVGDAPQRLNLNPADKCLAITQTRPDGQERKWELYPDLDAKRPAPAFNPERHTATLAPGALLTIGSYGEAPYGETHPLWSLAEGTHTLTVTYSASRDGALDSAALWKGTLTSAKSPLKLVPTK